MCAFRLADIKAAFSGDYKTFDLKGNYWSRQPNADGKLGKVTQTKRARMFKGCLYNWGEIIINILNKDRKIIYLNNIIQIIITVPFGATCGANYTLHL